MRFCPSLHCGGFCGLVLVLWLALVQLGLPWSISEWIPCGIWSAVKTLCLIPCTVAVVVKLLSVSEVVRQAMMANEVCLAIAAYKVSLAIITSLAIMADK